MSVSKSEILWVCAAALISFTGCDDCAADNGGPGDARAADAAVDAPIGSGDSGPCGPGGRACGASCCTPTEACGVEGVCCPREELCGTSCCGAEQICEGAVCHRDCGTAVRCHDETGGEVCCGDGEVCASERCFAPTTSCRDYIDCAEGEYCEATLGTCLPQPTGEACEVRPVGGDVVPTLVWRWTGTGATLPAYNQVMMTPVVANLTDDNSDGNIDEADVPDVIFSSFCGVSGAGCTEGQYHMDSVLRAVSGADGSRIFDVTDASHRVIGGAQIAVGDIDADGLPEIVACGSDPSFEGPLVAFEHTGAFKWATTDARVKCGQSAPAIADLDGDGAAEVFVRYTVVRGATGTVYWHHDCQNTGDASWTYEHKPCDYTTAADLDGDGALEVVGGNVAYHADGSTMWDRSSELREGYPAIGDLDLDGTPELVVVQSAYTTRTPYGRGDHFVRALHSDGTDMWGPVDLNFGMASAAHVTANTVAGGGPPTIANFDEDRNPEIALAGGFGYVVIENDGEMKWFAPTHDYSSRKTGSSVFDFDGDGVAEAVYNDEYWLRVYNGADGTVRYCQCNTSATHWEYPIIVDVDNDSHAEIVVASNDWYIGSCPTDSGTDPCTRARIAARETAGSHGIRVFASPMHDWVATRRVWNQHTYHVTNVSEAGAVPMAERRNWLSRGLNNFRQNVQPGATNLPDAEPIELAVDVRGCPEQMIIWFRVHNAGWSATPAHVPVTVYVSTPPGWERIGRTETTRALLPGESELLSMPFPIGDRDPYAIFRFKVVVNDTSDEPLGTLQECRDMNNEAEVPATCSTII